MSPLIDQPPRPRRKELRALTGIRSLAALWVYLYHTREMMCNAAPPLSAIIEGITRYGYLGVDLFFTLSGFILAYNYEDLSTRMNLRQYLKFLWLRLARIYPVHLFTLLLFVIAIFTARQLGIAITKSEYYSALDFIKNLFLIQAWSAPVYPSWNTLSWSVSCEWLAYIMLPICLSCLRISNKWLLLTCYCILSFALVFIPQIIELTSTYGYGLLRIATEFNLGIITYFLFKRKFLARFSWSFGIAIALAVLIGSSFLPDPIILPLFLLAPLFGFVILGIAYEGSWASKILEHKIFVYGGYISYSFYMIHELILLVSRKVYQLTPQAFLPWSNVAWICIQFIITILAAILIYHFVEEKIRIFMRNKYPLT